MLEPTLLTKFREDPEYRAQLADVLSELMEICHAAAREKGFHEDEQYARDILFAEDSHQLAWFDNAVLQAELARQASEIGEAVEAVRKPGPDHHLPQYSNFLVEEADCIVRIFDTCGKRSLPLGRALVDKVMYNLTRPHKHGKNS
jgi:NTP pyrophosphatase (non-canonical NTP hydrolase)